MSVHVGRFFFSLRLPLACCLAPVAALNGGKTRVAPSRESLLNALICSIEAEEVGEPDITLHTGTCKRYPSIHAFYTPMHESDTRRNGSGKGANKAGASYSVDDYFYVTTFVSNA